MTICDSRGASWGPAVLAIECLDRIYLNAYVPVLQSSGQVVAFMTQHLGKPIPSPALMEQWEPVTQGGGVLRGCERDPVGEVRQGRPKIDVMQPHIAGAGRHREVRGGRGQRSRSSSGSGRSTSAARMPWPAVHVREGRPRVTCYYFYLWDEEIGPAFIKVCAYFPIRPRSGSTGIEWAKGSGKAGHGSPSWPRSSGDTRGWRSDRLSRDHRGLRAAVAAPHPDALRQQGPRRGVLVGVLDAAGRGLQDRRLRRAVPGPVVLRGADRRQL